MTGLRAERSTTTRPPPADEYRRVRALTEELAEPLSPEDQTVQSMPDVSPTKWHRAHTSWFFEAFVLGGAGSRYRPFHQSYGYLFNSYYEAVGPRHPRAERGLVTRPGVAEVAAYRRHVDEAMAALLAGPLDPRTAELAELGLHHEQQHQELLLMDIKHVLSRSPLAPAFAARPTGARPAPGRRPPASGAPWWGHAGGEAEIGHPGGGFGFDNEGPRHGVLLTPFELRSTVVSCGEWLEFMADDGYRRPDLWLSEGWAAVQAAGWVAPLYWVADGAGWQQFTLTGLRAVDPAEPVCHVSLFEADAFARWAGARLPTEAEWEAVATDRARGVAGPDDPVASGGPDGPNFLDSGLLHPLAGGTAAPFGDVWQWTSSAYAPYPGFRPAPGAVGEYNGKFMVNQYVLRGGSCVSPAGHIRPTYRNFFPAGARWVFAGLRLARDA